MERKKQCNKKDIINKIIENAIENNYKGYLNRLVYCLDKNNESVDLLIKNMKQENIILIGKEKMFHYKHKSYLDRLFDYKITMMLFDIGTNLLKQLIAKLKEQKIDIFDYYITICNYFYYHLEFEIKIFTKEKFKEIYKFLIKTNILFSFVKDYKKIKSKYYKDNEKRKKIKEDLNEYKKFIKEFDNLFFKYSLIFRVFYKKYKQKQNTKRRAR